MSKCFSVMRHLLPAILSGVILAAISACRSQKEPVASSSSSADAVTGYASMVEAYKPWERIRLPFTLRLMAPKKFSISGTATFERGSYVHMSMRMLGMEVAVLQFTPDSLTLVEKMNKQYLSVPVAKALGGLDASIDNIEDLLTGRAFILGADSLTLAMNNLFKVEAVRSGQPWMLTPRKQPENAVYAFTISPTGTVELLTVDTESAINATATYTPATVDPVHGAFASSILVSTRIKSQDLQLEVEWDFSRARWDADAETKNISIGRGYRKLSVETLLKALPASSSN
ncbi:MAG: DUF4292 domain-containing protein [Bacteroides sp.]|nr:DUF4292 domain-containing protein [Bacteroides sp.]